MNFYKKDVLNYSSGEIVHFGATFVSVKICGAENIPGKCRAICTCRKQDFTHSFLKFKPTFITHKFKVKQAGAFLSSAGHTRLALQQSDADSRPLACCITAKYGGKT